MSLFHKAGTIIRTYRERGFAGVANKFADKNFELQESLRYRRWLGNQPNAEEHSLEFEPNLGALDSKPLLSIILPVFNVEAEWLCKCLDSVLGQKYENWELCIADDHSTKPHIRPTLEEYACRDSRIKVVFREENGHISAASNSALELAHGDFCILLDHDDELSLDALFWVANEVDSYPDVAMIYSDEDIIDHEGRRSRPKFKPNFSLDLLYSLNLVTHLSCYRTDVLRRIGGFRVGFEGSQDYDVALRFIERIDRVQIRHIPRILYHWRAVPGSVAFSADEKPYAYERAREAIREHFERTGTAATVDQTHFNAHRVRYRLPQSSVAASMILYSESELTNEARTKSWADRTSFQDLEIIRTPIHDSVAGSLNNAAQSARGEVLVFADAGILPAEPDWLEELVSFAMQPDVGAVGGIVINGNGRMVAGGVLFGGKGIAHVAHKGFGISWAGNMCRNMLVSNFSAVSGAFIAIRRELFRNIGGFDASHLPNALFDADLCLRIGMSGKRIILDPYALAEIDTGYRLVTEKLPSAREKEYFRSEWQDQIDRDPFYNPNFSPKDGKFRLAD